MAEDFQPLPPARRAMVTITIMAGTLMVVLDTTIANVALPHMQATLGATSESVAWVLTSYILASAIAMPVTGWLSDRVGARLLFTVAIAGFTISSALCGVANSLLVMVAARFLQGVFGAFIMPLSQSLMYNINPPEKFTQAMTIWGMGVMVGPIMGPMVGGWLTDAFDWRWVFFVNIPIGVATAVASWLLMPSPPTESRRFDMVGFVLLAVALGAFQLVLDRGTQLDWLDSSEILIEGGVMIAATWMFVVHMMTAEHPILPAVLFRDRNFITALVFVTLMGAVMMAGAALLAPMMQRLLGYPVFHAGMLVAPRGLGTMIGMVLAGKMIGRFDTRIFIFAGMMMIAWSLYMMAGFDLLMGARPIIVTGFIQGMGMGLSMMPLNMLAFATLEPFLRTEAAALYSLMRNIGGSVSISVTSALIAMNVQISHADLGTNLTTVSLPFIDAGLVERIGVRGEDLITLIDAEVNRQALMIAYLDDFWLMMWVALITAPLVMLMRPSQGGEAPHVAME